MWTEADRIDDQEVLAVLAMARALFLEAPVPCDRHAGKTVVVRGMVVQATRTRGCWVLSVGKSYPAPGCLSLWVQPQAMTGLLADPRVLIGAMVEAEGVLRRGSRPGTYWIKISEPTQIRLLKPWSS